MTTSQGQLFPMDLPTCEWVEFPAEGFSKPVSGVIYRLKNPVTSGMPLGGIDTGCLDLETNGLLGYCSIFNTLAPRRGPINLPILGLNVAGKTWVLCDPKPKDGVGDHQPSSSRRPYRLWQGNDWNNVCTEPITPISTELKLEGVETAKEIHYWGHYPVADLEFETDAPVSVGLRAWSPFLPGDVLYSMLPGIMFEVDLRNTSDTPQEGTIAFSFPGPTPEEAGTDRFSRQIAHWSFDGIEVSGEKVSYAVGAFSFEWSIQEFSKLRLGGPLGADGGTWAKIDTELPATGPGEPGSSVAVDFSLPSGGSKVVRFVLSWYAAEWNAGGYNWAGADHTFTHMYSKYYTSAEQAGQVLAHNHDSLLRRILAWQQVVYGEQELPVWLRESLVNVLHLITRDSMWAQARPPLPSWVKPEDGLFGMNECPRCCPQIECIPCSFFGNQPLVYFFPQLALSTLRGYKGYQYPDGATVWVFGGVTGKTAPVDFASPTRGYQWASSGIALAGMVDRYLLCYGDEDNDLVREFYPMVKQNMIYTVNLRPEYPIGERIIAMPTGNIMNEWFENSSPGWYGMTPHIGGLHLAQLRITERMANEVGDTEFAQQCAEWIQAAAESMENMLWNDTYYLNYFEPESGRRSHFVFGNQLDGRWIIRHHGLAGVFPEDRVKTTLATIKHCNVALSKHGAVNFANADGTPAQPGGYGTYGFMTVMTLGLAMTYMYSGEKEFGLQLAHKVWENLICRQGYTWEMPILMCGDVDSGKAAGDTSDYYMNMMLWSLPAAIDGKDFGAPVRPAGLVDRIIQAAKQDERTTEEVK